MSLSLSLQACRLAVGKAQRAAQTSEVVGHCKWGLHSLHKLAA